MKIKLPFLKHRLLKISLIVILFFDVSISVSQCCTYKLIMHDSYGDGWNGGHLDVYINNNLQGTHSAVNFIKADTFLICNGDSLKLIYTAGSYENENSYQLFDPAWNSVYSDGPNPLTGTVLLSLGNCNGIAVPGRNACTAIAIDTGQCIVADNTGFPTSGFNAGCANNQGADMWFRTTVPPSGCLSIATDSGSINDTGIAIWTDTTCYNLHSIACDDDSGPGYFSYLSFYGLHPGQQLYIQVWGYGGATGTFRLCVNSITPIAVDSSALPLVMINSLGNTIINNTKVSAFMDIKYNGDGTFTHYSDSSNVYKGNIGISYHGASSSGYPQHPFSIETRTATGINNNVPLLGMPAENDWFLISNYNDRSLVRNTLANRLFTQMGNYSPRTKLCEVFLDSIYQGIYVFCEKIKRDHNRVRISKMDSNDNAGDSLTGGYILQQNLWDASNSFQSNFSPIDHPGFDIHYLYEYPTPDSITVQQKAYIASFIDSLETALYSSNYADSTIGYRKYLDVKSFIDYFLVNEVSRNADGFKKSVFFNKDRFSKGGKLKAGPVWDFDWAWKDIYGCAPFSNSNGSGWAHLINDCVTDNYSNGYYIRMLQDTTFCNQLRCTYDYYRETMLSSAAIYNYIDSMKNLVQAAQARHFSMWPLLGTSGPAPEMNAIATTYNAEMDTLKSWIDRRLQWLDANIPGHCANPMHAGITENVASDLIKCYPNPGTGLFHFERITTSNSPLSIAVYDLTGKLIAHSSISSGDTKFDYSIEKQGVYYVTVTDSNGNRQYVKLIVL